MEAVAPDFSGYATKAGLKCSDGRTIKADAFAHMDGLRVPLVWQHGHDRPENVLGHGILEARDDGMYIHGFFNDTSQGENSKKLVAHGDIKSLSIYANQILEKAKYVLHGSIKEVSLVLSGANPGALIDYVRIAHSDDPNDVETLEDEAIIFTGLEFAHSDEGSDEGDQEAPEGAAGDASQDDDESDDSSSNDGATDDGESVQHADDGASLQDIYDTLTDDQKSLVSYMVGTALESKADSISQSDNSEGDLTHQEGKDTMTNVFEKQNKKAEDNAERHVLSHSDIKGILKSAEGSGSLKEAVQEYALAHSITDIDILFPDAKFVSTQPELISRRMEWVAGVIDGARKSPFSRIKSLAADLTADEARAKGYVKGNLKKEEIIRLLKRVTTPTTVYKKQKLDRDDIIDITDMDVVMWLKQEMRLMLEEEIARAILVGDGREPDDEDKIDEEKMRPIAWDDDMYAHSVNVPANVSPQETTENILRARRYYKGSGTPTLYTTDDILTDMILIKDKTGRRLYNTEQELAAALRVKEIIVAEVMEDHPTLLAIIVNMADYTIGADKGGQVTMFDDFDIDYNQYKYLIETRASGALTKPKSAIIIKRLSGTEVTPQVPTYNPTTHVLTIPNQTGVTYYDVTDSNNNGTLLTAGTHTLTETTDVEARPASGYTFPHNIDTDWTFAVV